MKLYECPRNTIVRVVGTEECYYFQHIDGAYSYCKDMQGNIVHLAAWTDVEKDSWENDLNRLEKQ